MTFKQNIIRAECFFPFSSDQLCQYQRPQWKSKREEFHYEAPRNTDCKSSKRSGNKVDPTECGFGQQRPPWKTHQNMSWRDAAAGCSGLNNLLCCNRVSWKAWKSWVFFSSKYMYFFKDLKIKFHQFFKMLSVLSPKRLLWADSRVASPPSSNGSGLLVCQRDCKYLLPLVPENPPEFAQI